MEPTRLAAYVRSIENNGYTIIPNVLNPESVAELREVATSIWRNNNGHTRGYLHEFGIVHRDLRFAKLVSVPDVLAAVVAIMGENISVYHSHLTCTGFNATSIHDFEFKWHRDAKQTVCDLGRQSVGPPPRVSLKAGYFLTSVERESDGATVAFPGSHIGEVHDEAPVPLLGEAGSCVIFDNRLVHSRGPNTHHAIRMAAYVAYGFRWLHPRDDLADRGVSQRDLTAVQQYLLCIGESARDRHSPGRLPTPC
ncbi:phytanoyl-CoA dioxygenase family protein [Nocardia vinacea]|uniref:phytanoyl-CoA dioxygenase family protein n=1 Tax=Nocardia vinacea TaxID=96468 RepID=UPI0009FF4394